MLKHFLLIGIVLLALPSAPAVDSKVSQSLGVRIVDIQIGKLTGAIFASRPDRLIDSGETVAVRVTVETSFSGNGGKRLLRVESSLIHPLGIEIVSNSSEVEIHGSFTWWFVFSFKMTPELPSGYYRVKVKATLGEASHEDFIVFYYRSLTSLENRISVEYSVEIRGVGEVQSLLLALPNDPSLKTLVGPIVIPNPSAFVRDSIGNSYVLYRDLKVDGVFQVKVSLHAVRRLFYTFADAPLSAPLPLEAKAFVKPSPYIESNFSEIVSKAKELVDGASTYREALASIADYVSSNIMYDESIGRLANAHQLGAAWTLNSRKGICLHISRLFVALARAAGIPARVVEGIEAKPAALAEGSTHAYVEVFIPGYGWLPVEPQKPSTILGLVPPSPGYVALVRGSGEEVELRGEEARASIFKLVYKGALSVTFTYSAGISPSGPPPPMLKLDVSLPSVLHCGDQFKVTPSTFPSDGLVEVRVKAPNGTSNRFTLDPGQSLSLRFSELGGWLLEFFAWRAGYLPTYHVTRIDVTPKPLKLSIEVSDNLLFREPKVTVKTVPPVQGAQVRLTARSCYFIQNSTLVTGAEGTATASLGFLLLPCRLAVSADSSPTCCTPARVETSVEVSLSPESIIVVLSILAFLVSGLARRRVRKSTVTFEH